MDYAVDSDVNCTAKRIKKEVKLNTDLQVLRCAEEIERILHSCHSSKESEYDCSARIYVRIGASLVPRPWFPWLRGKRV